MTTIVRSVYWPTREEALEKGCDFIQEVVKNTFNSADDTTLEVKCWLTRLECGMGTTDYFLETIPEIAKLFIQHYSSRGVDRFIMHIRTLSGNCPVVFDSVGQLLTEATAMGEDLCVFRNMKMAFDMDHGLYHCNIDAVPRARIYDYYADRGNIRWPYLEFFQHNRITSRNRRHLRPSEFTPHIDRPFLPRWGFGWPIAIYHGDDIHRVRNSLISFAMRKAAIKLDRRHQKFNRIVQKRQELMNWYIRKLENLERALDRQNNRIDRTASRAERLRLSLMEETI